MFAKMNLSRRSNFISNVRFLFVNQLLPLSSSVKHQPAPLCSLCAGTQAPQLSHARVPQRFQHTHPSLGLEGLSTFQRIKWNIGFYGKLQVPKWRLNHAGFNLYVCCTDLIDFPEFLKVLAIPDTFNSWFNVLQLHMWMVNVKLSQMGKEGVILKKTFYTSMWLNVDARLQEFQDLQSRERKSALENYHGTMILSILNYDEGLIGSDKQLANALWVYLFEMDPDVEADKLELMVKYIRKQIHHHDHLDPNPIMTPGYISFLPLLSDKLDKKKAASDLQHLTKGR